MVALRLLGVLRWETSPGATACVCFPAAPLPPLGAGTGVLFAPCCGSDLPSSLLWVEPHPSPRSSSTQTRSQACVSQTRALDSRSCPSSWLSTCSQALLPSPWALRSRTSVLGSPYPPRVSSTPAGSPLINQPHCDLTSLYATLWPPAPFLPHVSLVLWLQSPPKCLILWSDHFPRPFIFSVPFLLLSQLEFHCHYSHSHEIFLSSLAVAHLAHYNSSESSSARSSHLQQSPWRRLTANTKPGCPWTPRSLKLDPPCPLPRTSHTSTFTTPGREPSFSVTEKAWAVRKGSPDSPFLSPAHQRLSHELSLYGPPGVFI